MRSKQIIYIFFALILMAMLWNGQKKKVEKNPSMSVTPHKTVAQKPMAMLLSEAEQKQWTEAQRPRIQHLIEVSRKAAEGSVEMVSLVEKFEQSVRPTRIFPDKSTFTGTYPEDKPGGMYYQMLILDTESASYIPLPEAVFSYWPLQKGFMHVNIQPWQDWYLGVVMLHEMSHWSDFEFTRLEHLPESKEEDADGEIRAGLVEVAALDRLMRGRFTETIKRIASDPLLCDSTHGIPCQPTKEGIRELDAMWPDKPLSRTEDLNRGGSISYGLIFAATTDRAERVKAFFRMSTKNQAF